MTVELLQIGDKDAPRKMLLVTCSLNGLMRTRVTIMMKASGLPIGQRYNHLFVLGETIETARNIGAAVADLQNWEYLMFWDDDVTPHMDGATDHIIDAMDQNPDIDILGGVYPTRQPVPAPIVLKEKFGGPWWGWEDGGIHRVWMTGTGLTAYRMSSLRKLDVPKIELPNTFTNTDARFTRPKWFSMEKNTDDYNLAVMVEEQGLNWYVHGGVTADQMDPDGHIFRMRREKKAEEIEVAV